MRRILAPFAAALLLVAPLSAQEERSLRWDEVSVEAHLDADGRLHVRERQEMVFDGAWNGGEREFAVRLGQRLRLDGIRRLEDGAAPVDLRIDDDLDDVDEYDQDDDRVRWRSRLESDPPFERERITYVLSYTVDNAVLPLDSIDAGYLLDRDFLFTDRDGPVDSFSLALTLDPAWTATAELPRSWRAVDIPPGRGYAVRVPLRYTAAGAPSTVAPPVRGDVRLALLAVLLLGTGVIIWRAFRSETAAGRYEPLRREIDAEWLEEHVFAYPPEVVGAAWDGSTSAPEVAGLLARLVREGKLASRVEGDGGDHVLHLQLKVSREDLDEAERPLIDALFFDGRTEVDTETLRKHYKATGFDPAGKIAPVLERRLALLPGAGKVPRRLALPMASVALAVMLVAAAAAFRPGDALIAVLAAIIVLVLTTIGAALAAAYSAQVAGLRGRAIRVGVPLAVLVAGAAALLGGAFEAGVDGSAFSPYYRPGPLLLAALAALVLAAVGLVAAFTRPTDTPERLAFRRRLAAARAYFAAELAMPEPSLRDDWFPYLLALGLGPHVDRWFEAYGAAAAGGAYPAGVAGAAASQAAGGSGSGSPGGWTGGGPTFGGGGGFGGGGVGGSWAAAAGTIATGVAAPSSGGTAGGVASSGGGGGGGW